MSWAHIRLPFALALATLGAIALTAGLAAAMPTITVTSPANATLTNVSFTVFEANVNPPNASVMVDGFPVFPNATGNLSELVTLSEGLNALTITARDWLNETASVTVYVVLDTVPPNLTITAPANGTLTKQQWVQVWGTVQPPESFVEIRGNQAATDFSGNFSSFVSLEEGPNVVLVNATDPAGNTARASVNITLDTRPPSLYVDSPADGLLTNLTSIDVRGRTDADAQVTVNGRPVSVDGGGNFTAAGVALDALFDQTENLLLVRAVDPAGNAAYANVSVIVDVLAPIVGLDLDPELRAQIEAGAPLSITSILLQGTTDSVDANLTIANTSVPLAGLSFSFTFALAEGLNNISIRVQDAAGNSREFTLSVIRDTIAPTLSLTSPSSSDFLTNQTAIPIEGYADSADAVVHIIYTDARGLIQMDPVLSNFNVSSSRFEFLYTLVLNADGYPHVVTVRIQDVAGNRVENLFQYTVDLLPPALFLEPLVVFGTSPPRVWVNGSTEEGTDSVTINGEVAAVTVQAFSMLFDLAPTEGDTFFTVIATDAAGNSATETLTAHFEFPPPPLPAELHLSVNGSSPLQAPAGVPVLLTLDLQNASDFTVSWYSDGVAVAVGVNPTFTFSEGSHTVLARLSNGASSQNYTFTVVAVAPALPPAPLPPSVDLTVNGSARLEVEPGAPLRLSLNLSDASAYNITWFVDGQPAGTGASLELSLAAGPHTVTANVSNGQESRSYTYQVIARGAAAGPPPTSSLPWALIGVGAVAAAGAAAFLVVRRRAR